MIKQYFSIKDRNEKDYDYLFIRITEKKSKDDNLICELQKKILQGYRDPDYLQRKRRNLDRNGLIEYIQKKVIPNKVNNFDMAVRYGDFGEMFASLVIEYMYSKKTFHKLRWKYNPDKSVFGTDIVAFDSLENPSEITYYEVKTRENALEKDVVKKGNKRLKIKAIKEFVTIIAYKSLEKDALSDKESIMDYMSRLFWAEQKYDESDLFSDLVDGKKTVSRCYGIFVITDSNIAYEKCKEMLIELKKIKKNIGPLTVTFVFIDEIKELMTETWNTIAQHGAEFVERNLL